MTLLRLMDQLFSLASENLPTDPCAHFYITTHSATWNSFDHSNCDTAYKPGSRTSWLPVKWNLIPKFFIHSFIYFLHFFFLSIGGCFEYFLHRFYCLHNHKFCCTSNQNNIIQLNLLYECSKTIVSQKKYVQNKVMQ